MTRALLRYDEDLAVVRLGPGSDIPAWAVSGTLLSVTATAAETSLVCSRAGVPHKARQQGPYTAFAVEGPLDPTLTGVLSGLLTPLAESDIPVFTLSTFDTDWVLVPAEAADRAAEVLRRAGHDVRAADEDSSTSSPGGDS